jgi:hypothetical protein
MCSGRPIYTQYPMPVEWTPEQVQATIDVATVAYSGGAAGLTVRGVFRAIASRLARDTAERAAEKPKGELHAPGDVQDGTVIVRGATGEPPTPGTTYSDLQDSTTAEAGKGVPNGQLRETTAGEIRANGGRVDVAPEPSKSGQMNGQHVNVKEGGNRSS